jgi:hypothetical protein
MITAVADEGLVRPGDRVASADNWQRSAILCFRLGCTYLGIPAAAATPEERRAELDGHGVDRFLLWGDGAEDLPDLTPLEGSDDLGGLRVRAVPGR